MLLLKATLPRQFFEEEFWVDTGDLYSFVPEDYLERIGIEPSVTRNPVLADGRQDRFASSMTSTT